MWPDVYVVRSFLFTFVTIVAGISIIFTLFLVSADDVYLPRVLSLLPVPPIKNCDRVLTMYFPLPDSHSSTADTQSFRGIVQRRE
jgi:hypothetical protein